MDTQKQDVATLIELLPKWRPSDGRVLKLTRFPRANYCAQITPCLRCGRRPVGAPGLEGVELPPGVIKLWKQRLGRAN